MPLDDVARESKALVAIDHARSKGAIPRTLEQAISEDPTFSTRSTYFVRYDPDKDIYILAINGTSNRFLSLEPKLYAAVISTPKGRKVPDGGNVRTSYIIEMANKLRAQHQPA